MILEVLVRFGVVSAIVGLTWFYAWIENPAVSSGTVWFVGFVAGTVATVPRMDDL